MSETKEMLATSEKVATTQYTVNFANNSNLAMTFNAKDINNGSFDADPPQNISANGGKGQWKFTPTTGLICNGDVSYTTSAGTAQISWQNATGTIGDALFSAQAPSQHNITISNSGNVYTATMT